MLKLSCWQIRRLGRPPSEEGWLHWALQPCLPFLEWLLAHPSPRPSMGQGAEGQAIPMPSFPKPLPRFLPVMQLGSG